jgi:hypothetical protein
MQVEWSIHEAWLQWMADVYIPETLSTNCFKKYQFIQLLEIDETEGPTYALQLYLENKEDYNRYIQSYASALNETMIGRWSDKVLTFSTLMRVVY